MLQKNNPFDFFNFAAQLSLKADEKYSCRKACIGAVGFRTDGAIVHACSGGDQLNISPNTHAETRLLKKLDKYSPVIYVARIRRDTMEFALARPCKTCLPFIKNKRIDKIYYTINAYEYGIIDVKSLCEKDGIRFL